MRAPSENFRRRARTFHSISVGGRLVGLLKKISYSIFRRRSCVSSTVSSSSSVTGFLHDQCREVKYRAARCLWVTEGYGTKVRSSSELRATSLRATGYELRRFVDDVGLVTTLRSWMPSS